MSLEKRIKKLNDFKDGNGSVVYWMSRDQRVDDNWALIYATKKSVNLKQPLVVVFCLQENFLGATWRQYYFMLEGLKEVEKKLNKYGVVFKMLIGEPEKEIPGFIKKYKAGSLITDFDPLKIKTSWREDVAKNININFEMVDAHNIVPAWVVAEKQEFSARFFRPKIKKLLPDFLIEFEKIPKSLKSIKAKKTNWKEVYKKIKIDKRVDPVKGFNPGPVAGKRMLNKFIENELKGYAEMRNDPNAKTQSNLSPFLHFGQISAARVAIEVKKAKNISRKNKDDFLEELIVRRELSDNFCYYNKNYDSLSGLPDWALKTLLKHKRDKRNFVYSIKDFEQAKTHDKLWNATQLEMVKRGKMHGYMRMYWAKKILEWSKTPKDALRIAIELNDKYELDGRDPNGYTGIMWSIGGLHDRAWGERKIFGKVRYMSYEGMKRKFDVKRYIESVNNIEY